MRANTHAPGEIVLAQAQIAQQVQQPHVKVYTDAITVPAGSNYLYLNLLIRETDYQNSSLAYQVGFEVLVNSDRWCPDCEADFDVANPAFLAQDPHSIQAYLSSIPTRRNPGFALRRPGEEVANGTYRGYLLCQQPMNIGIEIKCI